MFKNMSREERFSGGQTSASSHVAHGVAPLGQENQESSWISMFSVVSRPALSFLQKYLPGRPRAPALSDSVTGWVSGDFKHNFVDEERAFFGQLDDIMPATQHSTHHLSYLHCQHDRATCLVGSNGESNLSWLTADSLRQLGIENAAEMDMNIRQQTHLGYLASARSFLSQVLLSSASAQEMKHSEGGHVLGGKDWSTEAASYPVKSASSSRNWWGGFWGSEENSQSWLSNISWSKEATVTSEHCPQPESGTKAAVAKPTELFVLCCDGQSMPGESAGPSNDKEEPIDNGSLQTDRPESLPNSEGLTLGPCISFDSHLVGAGAVTACSEVAVLTPDQDNGYSSLEEEHSISRLYMVKAPCEEEPQGVTETKGDNTTTEREAEGEISEGGEGGESMTVGGMEEEEKEEETEDSDISDSEEAETPSREGQCAAATSLTVPHCQNKAIAYIMGSPCSDDDSQSDSEFSDDDDGFDSEGSSEFSDSVDEDDDEDSDSDDQADSETERLWNSLCQSRDPYSPRNFTARIHTNTNVTSTAPRTIPASITASAASSCSPHSPASPPNQVPSPLSSSPASPPSPSPLRDSDAWDDSTSASEVDEAESLRLWNSLSSSSDPYSPLNFQAPLRTKEPPKAGPGAGGRGKKSSWTPPRSPRHARAAAASPPQYRKEEAEERLDSGFSETLPSAVVTTTTTTTVGCVLVKKVRFCEEVEEFFASCGEEEEEDRRGPWEELARDRCRFLRRCQEVEESIAYCLEPRHRSAVYQRLTVWYNDSS